MEVLVQVERPAVNVGDWGYQAYASNDHNFAQVQYRAPIGLFMGGADRIELLQSGAKTPTGQSMGAT